jgi:hypothetical protein
MGRGRKRRSLDAKSARTKRQQFRQQQNTSAAVAENSDLDEQAQYEQHDHNYAQPPEPPHLQAEVNDEVPQEVGEELAAGGGPQEGGDADSS